MIRVLLDDMEAAVVERLRHGLAWENYELVVADVREPFRATVERCRPHIAVLNRIHDHLSDTRRKIDALKELCPEVRIVAISEVPSEDDAAVVERGIFFYMTSTEGPELVRIIQAGAAAVASEEEATGQGP